MPNTIKIKGQPRYDESVAVGVITPGQLIKRDLDGKVLRHATAGGPGEKLFALEDSLQGKSIEDNYAVDDLVGYIIPYDGDEVLAWLDAGEDVIKGDFLQSAGNGNLEKRTGSNTIVGVACEALDLSASGAVATRLVVRVL